MILNKIKDFLKIFILTDLLIVIVLFFVGIENLIINTQVAFFSSLFISLFTYLSYSRNVNKSVQNIALENDLDTIDKIEDPYDLYGDDIINEEVIENPTKEEIQEAMKPVKKNYFLNLKNSFKAFIAIGRLLGYVILVLGFFFLLNNSYLNVYAYLGGFLIVPLSILVIMGIKKD